MKPGTAFRLDGNTDDCGGWWRCGTLSILVLQQHCSFTPTYESINCSLGMHTWRYTFIIVHLRDAPTTTMAAANYRWGIFFFVWTIQLWTSQPMNGGWMLASPMFVMFCLFSQLEVDHLVNSPWTFLLLVWCEQTDNIPTYLTHLQTHSQTNLNRSGKTRNKLAP